MNESKIALTERLRREGNWNAASKFKDDALREFRAKGMKRDEASMAAWEAMEAAYPPIAAAEEATIDSRDLDVVEKCRVEGLSDIPSSWGDLPPNASLASEIQWVQASRIDVVEESSEGVRIHLDRADKPAPSKSALGWLETSIRAYSKFVDVAAKVTSQLEDEQEHVRREKMSIEEIRSLLAEMLEPGDAGT